MKQLLLSLFALGIALSSSAQNFQPLQLNRTYQFALNSGADSLYTLKVESASVVNGDSVFTLNKVWKKVPQGWQPNVSGCSTTGGPAWLGNVSFNNLFGEKMISKQNGDYLFLTSEQDTFMLKTQVAVGTTFPFSFSNSLTATYQGQSQQMIAGNIMDQVKTYLLSTGATIKLSEHFGFVQVPSFIALIDPTEPARSLTFHSLPEKGLGIQISSPLTIHDYQPGDKFRYYQTMTYSTGGGLCTESWRIDSIISRTNHPGGDSVSYQFSTQTLTKSYASPGNPMGCTGNPGSWIASPTIHLFTVNNLPMSYPGLVSQGYTLDDGFFSGSSYYSSETVSQIHKSIYNSRIAVTLTGTHMYDTCSHAFRLIYDGGGSKSLASGLGLIHSIYYNVMLDSETTLEAYVKGTETYGTWTSLNSILSTPAELEIAQTFSASPNPFTSSINLSVTSARPETTTITVFNLLGQPVLKRQLQLNAGQQQVELSTENLASGMYQVLLQNGQQIQSLKVVKSE